MVIDRFYAYNPSRYGMPWICRVDDGRLNFAVKVGCYSSEKGCEGDLVVNDPRCGQIYAYGQKDYQNGANTLLSYAVWNGRRFVECSKNGRYILPHPRQINEKPLGYANDNNGFTGDPILDAVNMQRLITEPDELTEYPVNVKMYRHQIRGANMALLAMGILNPDGSPADPAKVKKGFNAGFGVLFDMGCGKSCTSVAIMGAMYRLGFIRRVLVVAPTSVCSVWPRELNDYAQFAYSSVHLTGTKEQRIRKLATLSGADGLQVAVINYESVWRREVSDAVKEWGADLIIADESQRIKSYKAKQSICMHELGRSARYKLILSGTPVQSNFLDLFSQYKFLDSKVFGDSYWQFVNRYGIKGGFENRAIIGVKNLDELIRKEYSIAYRVTKAEALDLPEQTFQRRYVELEKKAAAMYASLMEQSVLELESSDVIRADNALTKLLRLQQLTGGFITDDYGVPEQVSGAKLQALADIIEDYVISCNKKLVIFCRFRAEIDIISRMLDKFKVRFGCIYGDVNIADRGAIVSDFQNNVDTKVFLAQIDTAGLGITLTAADTCVYYSVNYNYAAYSQSLSRIHRIGQKNACTYIHIICENTIDEAVLEALSAKEDIAKNIVDSWKKYFRRPKKK